MKIVPPRAMISSVEDALKSRMDSGLRGMIEAQWQNQVVWELGDVVKFDPGENAIAYYPPSMPHRGAIGKVVLITHHHGGAQDHVLMEYTDGTARIKAAPMCWLRPVATTCRCVFPSCCEECYSAYHGIETPLEPVTSACGDCIGCRGNGVCVDRM